MAIPVTPQEPLSTVLAVALRNSLIVLLDIVPLADDVCTIPATNAELLVVLLVRLAIVFPDITNGAKTVVDMAQFIPYTLAATNDVVLKDDNKLLAVEVLPMVLPVTVIPAVLETAIPSILAAVVEVPTAVKEPIILFCMDTTAGLKADELIPTIAPKEPGVSEMAPVPVEAPIMLGVVVPILALPAVTLIPHKAPPEKFEVLVVVIAMLVMVLP